DVYADARLPRDHALMCRASLARLPPDAVVLAGPSAAVAHGVPAAASVSDPVHLILAAGRRVSDQVGTRLHRVRLDPAEVCRVPLAGGGSSVAVTVPSRTAWDAAVWLALPDAVAVVDALLFQGLVTPASLRAVAARLADRPGGRRARHTLALADGNARSPAESLLRVRLFLAGLPMALARPPVFAARPPLAWPDFRVALWCGGPEPAAETLMVDEGWLTLRMSPRREFADVVREVRAALLGRGWRRTRKQDVKESALTPNIR
ncbi:hypothetical protein, partial [Asanoa sp. NPDC050611]|uniref:hypothetical protein n=1 Tax=Asanoa sp. NPDC050611 TaxID=3157098 RepID=UPI0033E633FC